MRKFLRDGTIPPIHLQKDIYESQQLFTTDDEFLFRIEGDDCKSPYVPVTLRADFLDQMHSEYGHLGYPGIQGILRGRGWWHTLIADVKNFVSFCPKCQISQRSQSGLEREQPRTLTEAGLQLFDRWAIDLIGVLPQTPAGNRWIVTAIEYLTGWPIAKALPDAKAETIAKFIHNEITMVYGAPKELLSDNGRNLISKILHAYTNLLQIRHRVTTPYHPRTNGKVENFNGFLGATLTKMLVNQPIVLWDQYISQALFAIRIRIHATSRESPYSLLFGRKPRLTTDDNKLRPIEVSEDDFSRLLARIEKMEHARMTANKRLVERAIKANKIRQELVKGSSFKEGEYVLVRAEARNKFEGRWFGPYRIKKAMTLGTYKLEDPQGAEVRTLINGQRLIHARVNDESRKKLWNSSKIQGILRRKGLDLDKSSREVEALFSKEADDIVSYNELATTKESEWLRLEQSGDVLRQVGEEPSNDQAQQQVDAAIHEAEQMDMEEDLSVPPFSTEPIDLETIPNSSQTEIEQVQTVPDTVNEFLPMETGDDPEIMETPPQEEPQIPPPPPLDEELPEDSQTITVEIPPQESPSPSQEPPLLETSYISAAKRQRTSTWKRDRETAVRERERTSTQYELRHRPAKRPYEAIS
jgi:hypothetical protein